MIERYQPKDGDLYWLVLTDDTVTSYYWTGDKYDTKHVELGNCFKEEIEAKRHAARMFFAFRPIPSLEPNQSYYLLYQHTHLNQQDAPAVSDRVNRDVNQGKRDSISGFVFLTKEEAQQYLPLFDFAYGNGPCPDNFLNENGEEVIYTAFFKLRTGH